MQAPFSPSVLTRVLLRMFPSIRKSQQGWGGGLSRAFLPLCLLSPSLTGANDFPTSFLIRINREVLILSLKLLVKSQSSGIAETG